VTTPKTVTTVGETVVTLGGLASKGIIEPSPEARDDYVRTPFVRERLILPSGTRAPLEALPSPWGWQGLSEALYYRSYSREKKNKTQERWPDTVVRFVEGVLSIRKDHCLSRRLPWDDAYWQDYGVEMAHAAAKFEWSPPGRGLWAMGTDYVYERGSAALVNCSYVDLDSGDDLAHALGWAMDMLMSGSGVGFSVTRKPVRMEMPSGPTLVYDVHDTRESWVESYVLQVRSFLRGSNPIDFRYGRVRRKGEILKGIGGKASGPDPLIQIHRWVRETCVRFIRGEISVTVLKANLANFLGVCVSMGGIRRSSEILLGSIHDQDFLDLKNLSRFPEREPWYWSSNNTVLLETHEDFLALPRVAEGVRRNGEPGVANLVNMQKFARHGREIPDAATGLNPCVAGDTKIRTRDGDVRIDSLVGRTLDVWNGVEWSEVTPRVTGHDQPMVKVTLSNGKALRCTKAHGWHVVEFDACEREIVEVWREASFLQAGEIIAPYRTGPDDQPQLATIVRVEPAGFEEKVFCFTDPKNGTGTFDGIVTGQCGEVCLESFETCIVDNLYPSRCKSYDDLVRAAKFATFYNSTVALLPTHRPETNRVVARNRRIGVSIAGLADWLTATSDELVTRTLRDVFKEVRGENERLARDAGVPPSIRLTCVKPDGSVAKLPGCSEGLGEHKFSYAIRRMSVQNDHPVVPVLKAAGFPHEPSAVMPDLETCFEFPIAAPDGSRTSKRQTLWEQISVAVMMQREWSDNSCSITGEFDPETEGPDVPRVVARNIPMLKSFSALPRSAGAYKQMPYEEIDREQYLSRKAALRPLDWSGFHGDGEDEQFCQGGMCAAPPRPPAT
jgi:hypothetical protein